MRWKKFSKNLSIIVIFEIRRKKEWAEEPDTVKQSL